MEWIVLLAAAFLLGSVPFGHLVARSRGVDIRAVGSGNIGATNVVRVLGKKAGFIVLGLDVLKGLIPSILGYFVVKPEFLQSQQEFALLAGLVAVAGHCFSPFLGFRGGKGVATGLGAMLGGSPAVAVISFGVFLLLLAITRYVSLSSLIAVVLLPLSGWLIGHSAIMMAGYGLLGAFIILRHTSNIRKLLQGTERRFGGGRHPEPSCNDPETSCSDPETSCSDPDTSCSDLETSCNGPETSCSDPETSCNGPETSCSDLETSCSDPETSCNGPETNFTGRNDATSEWGNTQTDGNRSPTEDNLKEGG
ncbi:MAG: glycerol-3-phosphate 1-O-acyltransferase PlsY [Fimbriimonadaceae bacterium]